MAKKILVMVVVDNRLVRDGITTLLDAESDFKVVAAVEGGAAALVQALETRPQIMLVDAALGHHDSNRFVGTLRSQSPESRVVVTDLFPAQEDVIALIKDGASGFILKDATVEEFVKKVRSVAEGTNVVPPAMTGTPLSLIVDQAAAHDSAAVVAAVRMTKRERGITELIADGLSNKEIAERLNIATYTVKSHVHNPLRNSHCRAGSRLPRTRTELRIPTVADALRLPVAADGDIVQARLQGREMAAEAGFSTGDQTVIAAAISEIARNILNYAKRGEITLRLVPKGDLQGVEVIARDAGPGIPDIPRAMQDGYSTSGGFGLGLPGAKRLMDEFEVISEVGQGTTVTMTKWRRLTA